MSLEKLRERVAGRRSMPRLGNSPSTVINLRDAEALCDLADTTRKILDKELPHSGYCATEECNCSYYVKRVRAILARLDDAQFGEDV